MSEIWESWLRTGLTVANNLWWAHDQVSYEVVDGRRLSARDYRAAGCMRLAREAAHDFEDTLAEYQASQPPSRLRSDGRSHQPVHPRSHAAHPIVVRCGIAPASSTRKRPTQL